MSYKIRAEHLPTLADRIAKIAKRAVKLHLPVPGFQVVREYDEEVPAPDGIGFPRIHRYADVEVSGEAPRINGWRFIATLEHDEGDVLVRAVPGVEVPPAYRTVNPDDCDHCGLKRRRSNTYVLRNESEPGFIYKQVGSDCVRDFIGYDSPEAIARQIEAINDVVGDLESGEYSDYDGPREEARYDLDKIVGLAVAAVRTHGWVPRSKADVFDKRATVEYVQDHLFAGGDKRLLLDVIDQDRKDAETLLAWGREQFASPRSDYDHNMNVLLAKEDVRYRQLGFVCSLVGAWRKATAERLERSARPESQWLGEVGSKIEALVKVLSIREIAVEGYGYYSSGVSYLVLFEDEAGNRIKWFASNRPSFFKEGDQVRIVGTVKAHEEYKGQRQTAVLRVKEYESPEDAKARKKAQAERNKQVKALEKVWKDAEAEQATVMDAHFAKWGASSADFEVKWGVSYGTPEYEAKRNEELYERALLHGRHGEIVRLAYEAYLDAARQR